MGGGVGLDTPADPTSTSEPAAVAADAAAAPAATPTAAHTDGPAAPSVAPTVVLPVPATTTSDMDLFGGQWGSASWEGSSWQTTQQLSACLEKPLTCSHVVTPPGSHTLTFTNFSIHTP